MKRNTTTRDKHRTIIKSRKQPCAICGNPIDYTLKHQNGKPHPKMFVVDHIIPLAAGGTDTLNNKQPAHADCNRTKSDTTQTIQPMRGVNW